MTEVKLYRLVLAAIAAVAVLAAACSDNTDSTSPTGSAAITASFTGLQQLEEDLSYQIWAITESGGYYYGYPAGLFRVNSDGAMVDPVADTVLSGDFTAELAADDIDGFALSVEMTEEVVTYSSYSILLGGDVSDNQATLTTDNWLGMYIDLSGVSGKYTLATPTDSVQTDETSGIWFIDISSGISFGGLVLPEIASGWEYQGWVLADGQYLSTGKFSATDAADDENAYGGSYSSPAFPGEDFLTNAPDGVTFPLDLRGAKVIVTIEPWDEYDTETDKPFYITVLEADIPTDAVDHKTYFMTATTSTLPTGTITIVE